MHGGNNAYTYNTYHGIQKPEFKSNTNLKFADLFKNKSKIRKSYGLRQIQ